jgi:hypothetical protein
VLEEKLLTLMIFEDKKSVVCQEIFSEGATSA